MSPIVRTMRDVRIGITGAAALMVLATACILAFASPERENLIWAFLTTGCALLAKDVRVARRPPE